MRTAAIAVLVVLLPVPTESLERTVPAPSASGWISPGWTIEFSYYNFCTGWVRTLDGWEDGDVVGVWFPHLEHANVMGARLYLWSGLPSGYGYTGTIALHQADASLCPGPRLAASPFLPATGFNWVTVSGYFSGLGQYVMALTMARPGSEAWALVSDHPSAGPTGPPAIGHCYPSDRVTHSYYYGNETSGRICPGQRIRVQHDVELLWDIVLADPGAVESSSWGAIKSLYR